MFVSRIKAALHEDKCNSFWSGLSLGSSQALWRFGLKLASHQSITPNWVSVSCAKFADQAGKLWLACNCHHRSRLEQRFNSEPSDIRIVYANNVEIHSFDNTTSISCRVWDKAIHLLDTKFYYWVYSIFYFNFFIYSFSDDGTAPSYNCGSWTYTSWINNWATINTNIFAPVSSSITIKSKFWVEYLFY